MNGATLCRNLFCFLVKWKNGWWLQAEKNDVIGYGQFSATLENWGFISATTAELLFGSGRTCIARSLSFHVGTEPGEHNVTGAISRSTHIKSCLAKHFECRKKEPKYLRSGMQRDHMLSVLFPSIFGPWVPVSRYSHWKNIHYGCRAHG